MKYMGIHLNTDLLPRKAPLIVFLGLCWLSFRVVAEEEISPQSIISLAEKVSATGEILRAKEYYWLVLEGEQKKSNFGLVEAACKSLAIHISADHISNKDRKIWLCDRNILKNWLGDLDPYITIEPRRILSYRPCFPKVERFEGTRRVTVIYDVNENGSIVNLRIQNSEDERFNECSIRTAKNQRYEKGYKYGVPVHFSELEHSYVYQWEEE